MRASLWLVLLVALATASCGPKVDLAKGLQVVDVSTGWWDAGVVNGQNKLVPSISLKLKNGDTEPIAGVQLNAIFHRVGEEDGWGEHFVQAVDRSGLAPGATSQQIVLRSGLGYTGSQSRIELLQNSQFVDARVDIFGKQGRGNWVKLAAVRIDRQLLTQ